MPVFNFSMYIIFIFFKNFNKKIDLFLLWNMLQYNNEFTTY
jgi:hypothetical protein